MQTILREMVNGVVYGLVLATLLNVPLAYTIFRIHRLRKAYKAAADDPFKELPLRPAGESLRLKIDELADQQQEHLLVHLIASLAMIVIILTTPEKLRMWVYASFVVGVVIDAFTGIPKILGITKRLWDARLGYMGERAVAEGLSTLLVKGYRVFHDLPFEKFNIDHVVVGPKGLFSIETKTRRKSKQENAAAEYKLYHEGKTLRWPKYSETKTIEQALLNASTISKWIAASAAESVPAQAIVAVPGWFTATDTKFPAVWVLNPRGIKAFIEKCPPTLSPEQIQRIAFQLENHCRLKKE